MTEMQERNKWWQHLHKSQTKDDLKKQKHDLNGLEKSDGKTD